jgi:hypothetical protein
VGVVEAERKTAPAQRRSTNLAARKRRFLRALASGHSVVGAAAAAGRTARTMYTWRETDPEFAQRWTEAESLRKEAVAETVWKRAQDSDTLLMRSTRS